MGALGAQGCISVAARLETVTPTESGDICNLPSLVKPIFMPNSDCADRIRVPNETWSSWQI